jgi:hypothetical protein
MLCKFSLHGAANCNQTRKSQAAKPQPKGEGMFHHEGREEHEGKIVLTAMAKRRKVFLRDLPDLLRKYGVARARLLPSPFPPSRIRQRTDQLGLKRARVRKDLVLFASKSPLAHSDGRACPGLDPGVRAVSFSVGERKLMNYCVV